MVDDRVPGARPSPAERWVCPECGLVVIREGATQCPRDGTGMVKSRGHRR
jgi:rubrerythrin